MLGRRPNNLSPRGTGYRVVDGKRRSREPQHIEVREPLVGFMLAMGSMDGNALGGGKRGVGRVGRIEVKGQRADSPFLKYGILASS